MKCQKCKTKLVWSFSRDIKYKNDISTLAVPMNLPIYANKTTNTLELKPWF